MQVRVSIYRSSPVGFWICKIMLHSRVLLTLKAIADSSDSCIATSLDITVDSALGC